MVEKSEFDNPRPGETLEQYLNRHHPRRPKPDELEAADEEAAAAQLREQYTGANVSKDMK
jgi:hypothetical protein